jgi:hypothetical protein
MELADLEFEEVDAINESILEGETSGSIAREDDILIMWELKLSLEGDSKEVIDT